MMGRLDANELLEEAAAKAGLSDFADPSFQEGLTELLVACRQAAGLSDFGRAQLRARCLHHLGNRLRIHPYLQLHASGIREAGPRRPVVLATYPRSGSTLLHKLLCQTPGVRIPRFWECWQPTPPREGVDRRPLQATANYLAPMASWFADDSPARGDMPTADEAAECYVLLQNSFASFNDTFFYYIPGYLEWLQRADLRQAYREFAAQLGILSHADGQHGGPWILKSADHLLNIEALMAALPDARIIHITRPMAYMIPSLCRLMEPYINALRDSPIDPQVLGAYALARFEAMAAMARKLPEVVPADQLMVLSFAEIAGDPVGCVTRMLAWLDIPRGSEGAAPQERWLQAHPRPPSGYDLEHYGLSARAMTQIDDSLVALHRAGA